MEQGKFCFCAYSQFSACELDNIFAPLRKFFSNIANYNFEVFSLFNCRGFFFFWRIMTDDPKNSMMPSKIPSSNFPRATREPYPTSQDTQELCFKAVPHDCLFLPCILHGWELPLWKTQCHADCAFFIKMWPVTRLVSELHIQLTLWPNSHPHILDILLA